MRRILIPLSGGAYTVFVGRDLLARVASLIPDAATARSLVVVSDRNVGRLYGDALARGLGRPPPRCPAFLLRPGERSKTIATARRLWSFFLDAGLRRDGLVVALGGGVVGDVAGFAAATFMRGISLLQVPTSLIAQADASIGGKTGVNLPRAKNMVGAFHHPVAVMSSVDVLRTLPARHYRSGLAEVVKTAVVGDPDLFRLMEDQMLAVRNRDPGLLEELIGRCARVKGRIVGRDERDRDGRAVLNLGHTLGHAIEEASDFAGWTHGSAVAAGMTWAARFAVEEGIWNDQDAGRLCRLLDALGLPTSLTTGSPDVLLPLIGLDKKTRSEGMRLVVPEAIGSCRVLGAVSEHRIASSLEGFCRGGNVQ